MGRVFCITGIDTDIGKTIVTGLIARSLLKRNITTITQKIAQTGCTGISEDILRHREIMGIGVQAEDESYLTCPYVFSVPCSPHLAADLDNRSIDPEVVKNATRKLLQNYEIVLLEGAGGVSVPLTRELLFIDYVEKEDLPLILVTGPKVGSINHTLTTLEIASQRGISVHGIIYNTFGASDERVCLDSREIFKQYLSFYGFNNMVVDVHSLEKYIDHQLPLPDFSELLML